MLFFWNKQIIDLDKKLSLTQEEFSRLNQLPREEKFTEENKREIMQILG